MRVGNVEVRADGDVLKLIVHGCTDGYYLTFTQQVSGKYDALLRQNDVYQALRRGRVEMQREVIKSLDFYVRKLAGQARGKLRHAIDTVRGIYGL